MASTAGTATASGAFLADRAANGLGPVPSWITELGLPLAMLLGTLWALIWLFKVLLKVIEERIGDRDKWVQILLDESKRAMESRSLLIDATNKQVAATNQQTEAFERVERGFNELNTTLRGKPCLWEAQHNKS